MKHRRMAILVLVSLLCLAGHPAMAKKRPPKEPKPPKTWQLTITSGYRDSPEAKHAEGTILQIMADYPGDGRVFKTWKGSGARYLANRNAQRTTLTMPRKNIELRAEYVQTAPWNATYLEVPATHGTEDTPGVNSVYYHVPNPCRGIIIFCHGTGGRGRSTDQKLEYLIFLRAAAQRGIGYFATSSHMRGANARWDNANPQAPQSGNGSSGGNPNKDVQNILDIIQYMQGQRIIPAKSTFFSMGISQGSSFASILAFQMGLAGASFNIASGLTPYVQNDSYRTPSIICMASNDGTVGQDGLQKADQNIASLQSRNIRCEKHVSSIQAAYPLRFMALKEKYPTFSEADSTAVHASLRQAGILGSDNFVAVSRDQLTDSALQAALPAEHRDKTSEVKTTLAICLSEHEFSSDQTDRILSFLQAGNRRRGNAFSTDGGM